MNRIEGEVGEKLQKDNTDCDQINECLNNIKKDFDQLLTRRTEHIDGILERVRHQQDDLAACKKCAGDEALNCQIHQRAIEELEPVMVDLSQQAHDLEKNE